MAGLKDAYTKIFLKQANLPLDEESVKHHKLRWWKNPRENLDSGLTLTDEGFEFLTQTLGIKSYNIKFPKDFQFTTQVILWLDQFLDCLNYYTKKEISVFKEKKACELMLFSGDVRKYGLARALARQRELDEQKR